MKLYSPIHSLYYNDFHKLFDKIYITYDIPESIVPAQNIWIYLIKQIDVFVKISMKNENNYNVFDKFVFTSKDREFDFHNNNHLPLANNKYMSVFELFPCSYISKNFNYLFGLDESNDIDYQIEVNIYFEDIIKLFKGDGLLNIEIKVDFQEDEKLWQEHKNIWIKDREKCESEKLI